MFSLGFLYRSWSSSEDLSLAISSVASQKQPEGISDVAGKKRKTPLSELRDN